MAVTQAPVQKAAHTTCAAGKTKTLSGAPIVVHIALIDFPDRDVRIDLALAIGARYRDAVVPIAHYNNYTLPCMKTVACSLW